MSKTALDSQYRTPFWGSRTPKELQFIQQTLNNKISELSVNKICYRDLLKILVYAIENSNVENNLKIIEDKMSELSNKHCIQLNDLINLYACFLKLFKCSMRVLSTKQDVIKDDLLGFLKLPEEFVSDFVTVLYGQRRESMENSLAIKFPKYPRIESLNWRVDIAISTSSVGRGLLSTIVVRMSLSNGEIISYEVNIQMFHQLRYNVALVLKEMDDLLSRQTFRLAD
ncbi:unnamed protein product [Brachionus calyciflorus]|uniref:COMM domain-containing protein 5 n=1 Tax=Brachionus calyciflorus TaxID=104777 RepID=A0A814J205_9BILA|nr:unnamed protein product [Brachionus calyciflorus]